MALKIVKRLDLMLSVLTTYIHTRQLWVAMDMFITLARVIASLCMYMHTAMKLYILTTGRFCISITLQ